MKINKILLYNFNSFEGWNVLDFTDMPKDKNIILIGGKNGAGKTSLFTAIKIGLYGPLAFGYVGMTPHYIAKIKDCINSKAFQKDKVESKVQITISLMVDREIREYEITRGWNYSRQRLEEEYFVKTEGQLLMEDELSYFQNYLQSIVPPGLFEFFLFDGEEVGNIFSTSTYNTYVKNAVYTLCGLDTFEIIRKYTKNYVGKAVGEDEEKLHSEYESLRKAVEKMENLQIRYQEELEQENKELIQVEAELIELGNAFKKAGGITKRERDKLKKEFEKTEHDKVESTAEMKLFVEGFMPFYILKDFTGKITEQLEREEKGRLFYYVQQRLDHKDIRHALATDGKIAEERIDSLIEVLLERLKPEGFEEGIQPLHDLSREDAARVQAMISNIDNFDSQALIEVVLKKQRASERTTEINKILKNAMADEEAIEFTEKESHLLRRKEELLRKFNESHSKYRESEESMKVLIQQREKALQRLKENAQNKHVLELSEGLTRMMAAFLENKTVAIRTRLESLIVEKLQHIYRKNNLITHIEIGDGFEFHLYQDAVYYVTELAYLIRNLGRDGFSLGIGKKGQEILFQRYGVSSLRQLQQKLAGADDLEPVKLYKRIDINRLSKGERQIFILSLYWAIIELSGQEIPFIIDTPYARIDASHRKEISEKFFPNISRQVIILSTDEEINEEYYQIMKPYIAKEFLLVNDESQNRTSMKPGYFFFFNFEGQP